MPAFLTEDFLNEDPLARYRREHDEQQVEFARQRRREERERQRAQQAVPAPDDYWAEVDRRIEEKLIAAIKAMDQGLTELLDQQHASIQEALDRRDAAIQALRNEIEIKLGLGRKLARLKAEVAEARQQARDRELESSSVSLARYAMKSS